MNFDQIDGYLVDLVLELRKRGGADLRFVEEARGHLTDAVEQGIERGLDATAAQQEAIAQFGRAPSVARTFVFDKYRWFDLMVLVAAVIVGFAIAYVDASPNWDVNSELAAITDDPQTRLIPFLERIAPAALRPLGKPESLTDQSEAANGRMKKYQVVFGGDRKIVCTIEIRRGGRSVSAHRSRPDA